MSGTRLANINPDKIKRNPDNPRIIFREEELQVLLNSIQKVGIRVPLAIYEDVKSNRYILLDGERRWLCAKKLNLSRVPTIIEPRPTRLENILRMFNIHNVRVQWDLFATALKLKEIENLLKKENKPYSLKDITAVTGITPATAKRAFDILSLPTKYLNLLRKELSKPKAEQKFSEDFFLEAMKASRAIERYMPEVLESNSKEKIMQRFFKKYKDGVISNIVKLRDVSKIARSEKAGVPSKKAIPIIKKLINNPKYRIEDAYNESVADAYQERNLKKEIESLVNKLKRMDSKIKEDKEVANKLKELYKIITKII